MALEELQLRRKALGLVGWPFDSRKAYLAGSKTAFAAQMLREHPPAALVTSLMLNGHPGLPRKLEKGPLSHYLVKIDGIMVTLHVLAIVNGNSL